MHPQSMCTICFVCAAVGFFNFVVMPLFRAFTTRFHACKPLLQAVQGNLQYWSVQEGGKSKTPRQSQSGTFLARVSLDIRTSIPKARFSVNGASKLKDGPAVRTSRRTPDGANKLRESPATSLPRQTPELSMQEEAVEGTVHKSH